jgi:hypothetical protein
MVCRRTRQRPARPCAHRAPARSAGRGRVVVVLLVRLLPEDQPKPHAHHDRGDEDEQLFHAFPCAGIVGSIVAQSVRGGASTRAKSYRLPSSHPGHSTDDRPGGRDLLRCLVGLPGLTWDLILISALHPASYPQDPACDLHQDAPLETATNRWIPMGCGPNVDQAWLGKGPASLKNSLVPVT